MELEVIRIKLLNFSVFISLCRKYTDVCLGNKPANVVRYQYPGVYFSFERQCDLEFADDYTAWQPTKLQV